ncbi:MAG: MarR family transcriptional regulator [Aquisalimonadaceae bacterium]
MLSETLLLKPGYLIRRANQRSVAIFSELARPHGITGVQHIIMVAVGDQPGIDLSSLSDLVNLDKATTGAVVRRLAARGLVTVEALPNDKRAKSVLLTDEGEALSRKMRSVVEHSQQLVLGPLTEEERTMFFTIMRKLIGSPEIEQMRFPPAEERGETDARPTVILGVDRAEGRAYAERAAEQRQPLTLLARDGNYAADLANELRLRGALEVQSRSCSQAPDADNRARADVIAEVAAGAAFVVFSGWGEDADPSGPLVTDLEVLQDVLHALANAEGGLCILCSALAHLAPELDRLWRPRGVHVAGVAANGKHAHLAAECVSMLARQGAQAGGSVLRLQQPDVS